MSIEAVSWALNHPDVMGTDKVILIGIASHADKYGENAWPSIVTLMTYANVTERAVQYSISKLEERGLLTRVLNGGGGRDWEGDKRPNLYRLHGVQPAAPRSAGCNPAQPRVKPSAKKGEAQRAGRVKPTAPERSIELSKEKSTEPARGAGGSPSGKRRASRAAEDEWGTAIGADPEEEAERAAAREARKATRWTDLVNLFHERTLACSPMTVVHRTNGHALMKFFRDLHAQGITETEIELMIKEFFKKGTTHYDSGREYPAWQQFGFKRDTLAKIVRPQTDSTTEQLKQAWAEIAPTEKIDFSAWGEVQK
jgi:Helix-turn-helix domain